ncbi:MAG: hypothetical protein GXX96_24090 [Planctomycetaceae bacterium]|nr:hypothetical protein [Planctomycetaceae bacterium]
MMKHRWILTATCAALFATLSAVSPAAAPAESEDEAAELEKQRQYWLGVCEGHANDYRIFPTGEPDKVLKRAKEPIFRHTQRDSDARVGLGQIGLVFLWTDDSGHPATVITVIANALKDSEPPGQRRVSHVLQSLSTEPLTALWRGGELWTPEGPGVEWKAVPNAPVPGDSPAKRLAQARTIARKFRSHSIDSRDGRWELRLLSKPMYDYEQQPAESGLGGALLAFCEGTDPEVLLALETRPTQEGPRWHFAFAAFSNYELHGSHAGQEVWSVPPRGTPPKTSPRWAVRGIEIVAGPGS